MKDYEYLFLGAGLANIAAANYLLDNSFENFLIIERGSHLNQRKCPTATTKRCIGCHTCFTTSGLAGANALHGNKLCYFPASSACSELLTSDQLRDSSAYLNRLLSPFFDSSKSNFSHFQSTSQKTQKHYYSDVLNLNQFQEMAERLYTPLTNSGSVKFSIEIDRIEQHNGSFLAFSDGELVTRSKQVVIGTGRSIQGSLLKSLQQLGVDFHNPKPDVGVRIESNYRNFTDRYNYQVDPKFKIQLPQFGDARTFCAHNKGAVVPVKFRDAYYADGAFGTKFTMQNNIALMTRSKIEMPMVEIQAWCKAVNGSLANKSLIINQINLDNRWQWVEQLRKAVPPLPSSYHEELMDSLFEFIFESNNSIIDLRCSDPHLTVYGPAIDRYWESPKLGSQFQSSVDGISFIGDSAGISRGYVQALTSAVGWAIGQLNHLDESKPLKEKWQILA